MSDEKKTADPLATVVTQVPPSSKRLHDSAAAFGDTMVHDTSQPGTPNPDVQVIRPSRPSLSGRLGRYVIRKLLGRGGVGAVYEADDPELDRRVAIKVLREDRDGDTEGLRREAQALARLVHPNVITVHDVGVAGGDVFVVMQLVDGETIDRWLAPRALPPSAIVEKYLQAGEGLAAAHAAGLVHCDFKPGNVLVDRDGQVRVGDFGLARATHSELVQIAGTPAYMAPEQFEGVGTAASDQFAFCITLWEALAGARPFDDPSIAVPDATRVRARELRGGEHIPAAILPILQRGLAPAQADRYPSMRALLDELETAIAPPAPVAAPPRPSRAWILAALGGAVMMAGGVAAIALWPAGAKGLGATIALRLPELVWPGGDFEHARMLTHYGDKACPYAPVFIGDDIVYDLSGGDDADLYAVSRHGGQPRRLTTAPTREWRPARGRRDGEVVYLVAPLTNDEPGEDQIAALDLATGTSTVVLDKLVYGAIGAPGGSLYFSPDQPSSIRKLADKRVSELVTLENRNYYQLAISNDGSRLAAASTDALSVCVLDPTADNPKANCWDTHGENIRPAFGVDNRMLYYGGVGGIRRREESGHDQLVSELSPEGGIAISADGLTLAYSNCAPTSALKDLATGEAMFPDEIWASQPTVARDGTVAYVRGTNNAMTLVIRGRDGTITDATRSELGMVETPAFSADGKRVAFRVTGERGGIWLLDLAAPGDPRHITTESADNSPHFTSRGDLVFERQEATGSRTPYLISLKGGAKEHAITAKTFYVWGIRGDDLLVSTADGLFWLDAYSGEERPGPVVPAGYFLGAAVSSSGEWVMIQMMPDGQDLWRAQGDGPLEHVKRFGATDTVPPATIDDNGHILAAPGIWSGEIFVVDAKPGMKF